MAKLRGEGPRRWFKCPGCDVMHCVIIEGPGAWGWNGSVDAPTFTPSVLVTNGHFCSDHKPDDHCWCKYYAEHPEKERTLACGRCHSFVRDGMIQFLADCTHNLKGQTVPLPEIEAVI